ncbi:MAG: hypothetical protein DME05_07575 [Candidatus Rokuibacteriota bacterium]|nr:MAG: hypothetical protein DME05_07575 [Candidatus Rokubacteria bacterium]
MPTGSIHRMPLPPVAPAVLECVPNVSEGRDRAVINRLADARRRARRYFTVSSVACGQSSTSRVHRFSTTCSAAFGVYVASIGSARIRSPLEVGRPAASHARACRRRRSSSAPLPNPRT